MDVQAPVVFLRCFDELKDPRRHNVRQLLSDILAIAILAIMCRADEWPGQPDLARHVPGIAQRDSLGGYFSRLFARLAPEAFENCFSHGRVRWRERPQDGSSPSTARRCVAVLNAAGTSRS